MQEKKNEIAPPWVEYPEFSPGDGFWRQSGEPWLIYVWEPFWNKLTQTEKEDYLKRWNVPEEWRLYSPYFNSEIEKWLESVDDDLY